MCDQCAGYRLRVRACKQCGAVRGPAPPGHRLDSWLCPECDPTSPWNIDHMIQYEALEVMKDHGKLQSPKAAIIALGCTLDRATETSDQFNVKKDGKTVFQGTVQHIWEWVARGASIQTGKLGVHRQLTSEKKKIKALTRILRSCATELLPVDRAEIEQARCLEKWNDRHYDYGDGWVL